MYSRLLSGPGNHQAPRTKYFLSTRPRACCASRFFFLFQHTTLNLLLNIVFFCFHFIIQDTKNTLDGTRILPHFFPITNLGISCSIIASREHISEQDRLSSKVQCIQQTFHLIKETIFQTVAHGDSSGNGYISVIWIIDYEFKLFTWGLGMALKVGWLDWMNDGWEIWPHVDFSKLTEISELPQCPAERIRRGSDGGENLK